jgi:nucleosome binding factor SPN SPT16 subunit
MITLVHFNLRDPIMVAKKKTSDVQASVPAWTDPDMHPSM